MGRSILLSTEKGHRMTGTELYRKKTAGRNGQIDLSQFGTAVMKMPTTCGRNIHFWL